MIRPASCARRSIGACQNAAPIRAQSRQDIRRHANAMAVHSEEKETSNERSCIPNNRGGKSVHNFVQSQLRRDTVQQEITSDSVLAILQSHLPLRTATDIKQCLDDINATHIPSRNASTSLGSKYILGLTSLLDAQSNRRALIRLLPIISTLSTQMAMHTAVGVLAEYTRKIGEENMLAVVPRVVGILLKRIDEEIRNVQGGGGVVDAQVVVQWCHAFTLSFFTFASHPGSEKGRKPHELVKDQTVRVIRHLMNIIDSLPSTSTSQPTLHRSFITQLLSQPLVSSELRDLVISHAVDRNLELSASQWHRCFLSAAADGDENRMKTYLRNKDRALRLGGQDDDMLSIEPIDIKRRHIDTVVQAGAKQSFAGLARSLGPFLHEPLSEDLADDPSDSAVHQSIVPYAWSMLLTRAARDPSVSAQDLFNIQETMPPSTVTPQSLTSLMHGLVLRGHPRAWSVWRDIIQLEKERPEGKPPFIDSHTLAVATAACYTVSGLEAAFALIDLWARRPTREDPGSESFAHSVQLDSANVNALLRLCRKEHRPSVAFRLFEYAKPRWGVDLDDISLSLLIDSCHRDSNRSHHGDVSPIRDMLDTVIGQFAHRRDSSDVDGEIRGIDQRTTASLLDPPGYRWSREHGWISPGDKARQVFRDMILGNWPHLSKITSPLNPSPGSRSWLSSFFGPDLGRHISSEIHTPPPSFPSEDAKYTHIIPTSSTFHRYIILPAHIHRSEEIPLALAWMRALHIRPDFRCMTSALKNVGEAEGPRRSVRGWGPNGESALVRDEEILRRWLEDWLGGSETGAEGRRRNVVPSEAEVAQHIRWLAKQRNERQRERDMQR